MKTTNQKKLVIAFAIIGSAFMVNRSFALEQPVAHYRTVVCATPGTGGNFGSACYTPDSNGPCDRKSECILN